VLLAIIAINAAFFFPSHQIRVAAVTPQEPRAGFAERLAHSLRFQTTRGTSGVDGDPFEALRQYLEREFPVVHQKLEREIVGGRSLLFRWPGRDHSRLPILLMSHLDVVPVEPGTEASWTHPPYSGEVVDGFIWGRGALDAKCGALGLLEAVDMLLSRGFQPSSDVYLALGHDEETGGLEGNRRIAERLRSRGVRFRFVLDEGGGITQGIMDGIDVPVAFVGVAEKGHATIRISATSESGHASMPPTHTAVGILAAAITELEEEPFPPRIDGATSDMLDFVGPEMPWPRRAALANRWLTGPFLTGRLARKPSLNALIRTTTAVTIAHGGETSNVLPERAHALVNVRILPGDTAASALEHFRRAFNRLGFTEDVLSCKLEGEWSDPSLVSPVESPAFRTLHRTIAEVYPNVVVTPGLALVATDSRHYASIAREIYRFLPLRLTADDLERIHGTDERIGANTYKDMIGFLIRLIENLSMPEAG
jgi:carboxypeptidase PM20D1